VRTPPEMICTPPPPKAFGTPANYIYFDLIKLPILPNYYFDKITKFVKLPILWSQILPCRPRKQILLNIFLGLSGHLSTPPNENMKIRLWYGIFFMLKFLQK
jgi:hypothetical protein